jgi:nicotinate-nucleotide adenylyltransferase
VEAVKQAYPDDELVLVLGTDAYEKIDRWHRAQELKALVTFEVIQRPQYLMSGARDIDAINVSATQVRNNQSQDIPQSVKNYIQEHHLYGN